MKVLLVDDHAMFREGLSLLVAHRFADVALLHAATLAQALAVIARHADIDVVLLDLGLPDSEGLETLTRLHDADVWSRIVVLSADDSPSTVQRAIEQGAAGFLPKTAEGAVLEEALRIVLDGGVYLPPHLAPAPARTEAALLGLSPRQLEVLHWLIKGAPNKRICRELHLAPSTVKTHVDAIFKRLEVNNRTQAVLAAARLGLRLSL